MRFTATLFILGSLVSTCAYAVCGAPQPRLVCAEYFKSQVVVTAKLVRTRYVPDTDGHLYEMKTAKVFRGDPGQTFWIYEENSSGRATFDWKPEESCLLFLYDFSKKDGGWLLDGCGNSGPLQGAGAAIKQINQISGQSEGMIQVA